MLKRASGTLSQGIFVFLPKSYGRLLPYQIIMSMEAMIWAWNQPIKNPHTKSVLVLLCSYASEDGASWSSIKNLSKKTSISESTVKRSLAWLDSNGFIKKDRPRFDLKGRFLSNDYFILHRKNDPEVTVTPGLQKSDPGVTVTLGQIDKSPGVTVTPHILSKRREEYKEAKRPPAQNPLFEPESEIPQPKKAVKAKIPPDWKPSTEVVEVITMACPLVDLEHETMQFKIHFKANGQKMEDWDARWEGWIRQKQRWMLEKLSPNERRIKKLEHVAKVMKTKDRVPSVKLTTEYFELTGRLLTA